MEKAIIVVLDVAKALKRRDDAATEALAELNAHLADGWRVKHSFAMGGTGHNIVSASLVILARPE
ncbi:MAG TPA: hypothetical protein VNA25_11440 [Phycisphaerae bacterium]|nr:hypothetical protein [Phycisphaerae bacterium]